MVTQSGSDVRAFVPRAPSRIVVAGDGTLAAICDPPRVVVVELPSCAVLAEISFDPAAERSDVAWVGPPARLVMLARYAAHSTVHLILPHGPRPVAEIRLETPMQLVAAVGTYALAVGPQGSAVLSAGEAHVTPYQFPARSVPIAAGSAAGQFVVALSASIEEWDPQTRMPKRRLKLPGPAGITAVGGSDRVVWMTTQQDPTKIDVFAMVNRGQPKRHQLPEPIAHVSGHPRSDLLVCRGADSDKLYVVDLDGKSALRSIDPTPHSLPGSAARRGDAAAIAAAGIDRATAAALVFGRSIGALVAQAERPITLVPLGSRDVEVSESPPRTGHIPRQPANGHAKRSTLYGDDDTEADQDGDAPAPAKSTLAAMVPAVDARQLTASLAEHLSTWREQVSTDGPQRVEVPLDGWEGQRLTWRDELAAWTRAVGAGGLVPPCPDVVAVATMLERFALAPELTPAMSLLYGAHLCGQPGAAPVDVARVLERNWDEALGKGQLQAAGVARFGESRVRLAQCVERALDGLAPLAGVLVGNSGPVHVLGPCVVVSASDDVGAVAETCVETAGGAILASSEPSVGPEFVLEARAYGAVAMARLAAIERMGFADNRPLIIVAPDEATAEALGLPRLQ